MLLVATSTSTDYQPDIKQNGYNGRKYFWIKFKCQYISRQPKMHITVVITKMDKINRVAVLNYSFIVRKLCYE